jgi:hypothetical protein
MDGDDEKYSREGNKGPSEEENIEEIAEAELLTEVKEGVTIELNENHHYAYMGQQLNQINGQLALINSNINNFRLLHKDLRNMNEHLWWLSFAVKLGIAGMILQLFLIIILFASIS